MRSLTIAVLSLTCFAGMTAVAGCSVVLGITSVPEAQDGSVDVAAPDAEGEEEGATGKAADAGDASPEATAEGGCIDGSKTCFGNVPQTCANGVLVAGPACTGSEPVCTSGVCNTCESMGLTNCSGVCKDISKDPANCGGCGATCATVGTSSTACVSGACVPTCLPNVSDCGDSGALGCTTDTTTAAHCGSCAVSCDTSCAASDGGHACTRNFWGDGSDGNFVSNGSVANDQFSSNLNGDMLVKQFTGLTINAGDTVTVTNPNKGLLIYVAGDAVINGRLTMAGRGANVDPTTAGVPSTGFSIARASAGGAASGDSALAGAGTAAVTAESNQPTVAHGVVMQLAQYGAAGAPKASCNAINGGTGGTDAGIGFSGGGSSGMPNCGFSGTRAGAGGKGTVFSGGAGGGGSSCCNGTDATGAVGGAGCVGSSCSSGNNYCALGGVGNPPGQSGGSCNPNGNTQASGTGGLLILLVKGNLTVGSAGQIDANGVDSVPGYQGQSCVQAMEGGASGGGNVIVLYGGALSQSGQITATGGKATHSGCGNSGVDAVAGDGSVQVASVSP